MYHFCKVFQTVSLDLVKFSCAFQGWNKAKTLQIGFHVLKKLYKNKKSHQHILKYADAR